MASNIKSKPSSKESPTEPFKRAVTGCLRALARKPDLEVSFAAERPGLMGGKVRLPEPPRKLSKAEVDKVKRDSSQFIRFMVEHLQRKRGRELERTKIRVKHGDRYGEVILLDQVAFIVHDIDKPEKEVSKAIIRPDGSLGTPESTTMEELEQHLAKIEIPAKVFIKQPIFEQLKGIFGKDVEVLVNY